MTAGSQVTVSIDFRDFRYLSNLIKFQQVVTDPDIISGKKEGTIEIDLNKMKQEDDNTDALFITGGRMYFEASVFGLGYTSFSTNAFID